MLKDEFIKYLSAERNYSALTVNEYDSVLSQFANYMNAHGEGWQWSNVEEDDIREWIVEQMDQGSKASSVNTRLSALRSFYKYLLAHGRLEHDPTRRIEGPKKSKPLPYYIRESEMDRLLDVVRFPDTLEGVRDHLMLLFFYTTGVRLSELVGLNVVDVDFGAKNIKVTGKRNKQRIIPFGKELEEEVKHYLDLRAIGGAEKKGKPLFVDVKDARISPEKVRSIVEHYLGMVTTQKKKSPHVLRHSFATAMLNHGAEIEVVKELLGHESLATTAIYTHTTFEELKKIYTNAHPRA